MDCSGKINLLDVDCRL